MKTDSPRLFVAIPLDERWKEHLIKQRSLLQSKLLFQKWTHPDDYHITLKFLGGTTQAQMDQISKHLADVASTSRSFELQEKAWGAFGPSSAPSILWAGVGGDLPVLNNLQKKVDNMAEIGFPPEDRGFHPHLTIARRYKGTVPITALIAQYLLEPAEPIHSWPVNEIQLFQSHIHKNPMYEPIATFKFHVE